MAVEDMVNHLTNGPAFRPILGVKPGFGKPLNLSLQVSGQGFDVTDPGLNLALINVGRRLEPTNRIAQFLQIQGHPPSLTPPCFELQETSRNGIVRISRSRGLPVRIEALDVKHSVPGSNGDGDIAQALDLTGKTNRG